MNSTSPNDHTPRRRRISFSLKTMFLVVTLICIAFGAVVAPLVRQHRAINVLECVKARIQFSYQYNAAGSNILAESPAPNWLRGTVAEEFYRNVHTVDLSHVWNIKIRDSKVADDDLALFKDISHIKFLNLGNNWAVTDQGLVHLSGLKHLRTLSLFETNVQGLGLRHLVSLEKIESFDFKKMPLTGEGFEHFHKLPKLRSLELSNTKITDETLTHVGKIRSLETLDLKRTDVTDAGIESLSSLSSLKSLALDGTNVTATGVARLEAALPNCSITPSSKKLRLEPRDLELWPDDYHPSQEELVIKINSLYWDGIDATVTVAEKQAGKPIVGFHMRRRNVSDKSLLRLLAEMPDLNHLDLGDVLVGDTLAKELPQLKQIIYLAADGSRITDTGLPYLARLTGLRTLSLRRTRITDAGIMHLKGLSNIRELRIGDSRTTSLGRHKLQQVLPNCIVD